MNYAVQQMLDRYTCHTLRDFENALKEIIQEIALLGLWRAKFFEKAAFYGGSALRILYQLDRFSEDLDFTLLQPQTHFDLSQYHTSVVNELHAFGFSAQVSSKQKTIDTAIQSAFIKANTLEHLIMIGVPQTQASKKHKLEQLQIKFEVDINPPVYYDTDFKYLLHPIEFSICSVQKSQLFAGKLGAVLGRAWKNRVKGRDWFDWVWYVKNNTSVSLFHLNKILQQAQILSVSEELTSLRLKELLIEKVDTVSFDAIKQDILPFIKDTSRLDSWSPELFHTIIQQMKFC